MNGFIIFNIILGVVFVIAMIGMYIVKDRRAKGVKLKKQLKELGFNVINFRGTPSYQYKGILRLWCVLIETTSINTMRIYNIAGKEVETISFESIDEVKAQIKRLTIW